MIATSSEETSMLNSCVCTSVQLKTPELQQWMPRLKHPCMVMHRKLWEWAYIAQALSERGMLQAGHRGLGFAVGKEPLAALFAAMGCQVVATDLDEATATTAGWTTSNQHARDLTALNEAALCPPGDFAQRVSFRVVDMNDIPDDLTGFDFVWSSCAIEHLGDMDATSEFLSRMMTCLRPGGIAVHTTEYNLTSDTDTIEHGNTVIFRRSDLIRMQNRLRGEGHRMERFDFEVGDAPDDQVILHPPYDGQPCLKIWIGPHAATSIGLIAEAGDMPRKHIARARRIRVLDAQHATESATLASRMRNWFRPAAAPHIHSETRGFDAVVSETLASMDDVHHAYRLLLGREPDAAGLEHYGKWVRAGTATPRRLANSIIASEEFTRQQHVQTAPVEVTLDGYSMFVRPNDHDIGGPILETKTYEPHVTRVVRGALRPGHTFVDVGANVGYFIALAAHIVGSTGKVIAVEPMDKNVQLLYATIWRNSFRQVDVFPYAASDADGLLPMMTGPGTSNGEVVLGSADEGMPSMFAQARRLDDLLADLRSIRLLKIDIEGHELLALRGFAANLARHRPEMLTEFHPKCMRENSRIDPAAYLAFLFDYGAEILVLHCDGRQHACNDADEVMREWQSADLQFGGDGTAHLDLFVRPHA